MAINTLADLKVTPSNNVDFLGQSTAGTNPVKTLDDMLRSLAGLLARGYADLGGTGTVGGSGNAITLTTASVYQTLKNGILVSFKALASNTGSTTFNLDGLGAKAVRRQGDSALLAGDIAAGGIYLLRYDTAYDGANGAWVLLNPEAPTPPSASDTVAGIVELATAADLRSATPDKVVGADVALSAMDWVALTDAATIAVDHAGGVNRKVTLGGNRAFGAPSNAKVGWPLNIWIVQDGTGSRVPTWATEYDFRDYGTPTLSTGAGQADLVCFVCLAADKFAFLGIAKRVD